jgi:uncharacterized membrane-anchored protein
MLMEAMQNPVSGKELGFVAPAKLDWFVVFEFDDVGYVRDDEKGSLDPDAMLQSMKAGTEAGNHERKRRGWPALNILGWEQKPHYNETTRNLEWAIKGESEGKPLINYNTRVLGRGGVMRVTLVTDPPQLATTLPMFKTVLGESNSNKDRSTRSSGRGTNSLPMGSRRWSSVARRRRLSNRALSNGCGKPGLWGCLPWRGFSRNSSAAATPHDWHS